MGQWECVMRHELAEAVSELWQTIGRALEGYRPEMHYMRGPGPKWHAKHSRVYEGGEERG
jgi:hypothetical protein